MGKGQTKKYSCEHRNYRRSTDRVLFVLNSSDLLSIEPLLEGLLLLGLRDPSSSEEFSSDAAIEPGRLARLRI
jgi:hypothetical protein